MLVNPSISFGPIATAGQFSRSSVLGSTSPINAASGQGSIATVAAAYTQRLVGSMIRFSTLCISCVGLILSSAASAVAEECKDGIRYYFTAPLENGQLGTYGLTVHPALIGSPGGGRPDEAFCQWAVDPLNNGACNLTRLYHLTNPIIGSTLAEFCDSERVYSDKAFVLSVVNDTMRNMTSALQCLIEDVGSSCAKRVAGEELGHYIALRVLLGALVVGLAVLCWCCVVKRCLRAIKNERDALHRLRRLQREQEIRDEAQNIQNGIAMRGPGITGHLADHLPHTNNNAPDERRGTLPLAQIVTNYDAEVAAAGVVL